MSTHSRLMKICVFLNVLFQVGGASEEISLGTTLVALKYDGGVVVGADSRTSTSMMVSNKFAKKINVIVDSEDTSCVICRSGSAADTQLLARATKEEFRSRFWRYNIRHPTVSQVSHFLRSFMRSASSSRTYQASLICAGRDDSGGKIFSIATDGGAMWEEEVYCVSGSGSTFLIGYLDSLRLDSSRLYSEDQAIRMVLELLKLSIQRDGSSGGVIRIMILKKGGVEERVEHPEPAAKVELAGFAEPFQGLSPLQ